MVPTANLQARSTFSGATASVAAAFLRAAAMTSVTLALICNGTDATAGDLSQPTSAAAAFANVALADVEDGFWACDYIATTRGPTGDVERCSTIYDALKERKFGGDFGELVRWWSRNKAAQHERMAMTEHRAAEVSQSRGAPAGGSMSLN